MERGGSSHPLSVGRCGLKLGHFLISDTQIVSQKNNEPKSQFYLSYLELFEFEVASELGDRKVNETLYFHLIYKMCYLDAPAVHDAIR